jgi:hypothetical protein
MALRNDQGQWKKYLTLELSSVSNFVEDMCTIVNEFQSAKIGGMDTIKLWARNGDAVRQALELGELVHLETASEELTDEFLLFAIRSGLRRFPIHARAPRSAWR